MIDVEQKIYDKLEVISNKVQLQLKKKGIIVPSINLDGSIQIGTFKIQKQNNTYYIANRYNEIVVTGINLPQSAALIANDLALGKFLNRSIYDLDQKYGHAEFEESLHKHLLKKTKTFDRIEMHEIKGSLKKYIKNHVKKHIHQQFEKLLNSHK